MYKIIFFVPATHLEKVKNALFKLGAGKSEKYAACCWETLGTFQFIPLINSNPTVGEPGELSATAEYKVEMICDKKIIKAVITELKHVHPYEEPAYEIHRVYQSVEDIM